MRKYMEPALKHQSNEHDLYRIYYPQHKEQVTESRPAPLCRKSTEGTIQCMPKSSAGSFLSEFKERFGGKVEEGEKSSHISSFSTLPNYLREKFEHKSGLPLDDVQIHYNSDKPAEIGALAYTKGTDIFIGSGQEKHLEHEVGHVIQQKMGSVQPNCTIAGQEVNIDPVLEAEADQGCISASSESTESTAVIQPKLMVSFEEYRQRMERNGESNIEAIRKNYFEQFILPENRIFYRIVNNPININNSKISDRANTLTKRIVNLKNKTPSTRALNKLSRAIIKFEKDGEDTYRQTYLDRENEELYCASEVRNTVETSVSNIFDSKEIPMNKENKHNLMPKINFSEFKKIFKELPGLIQLIVDLRTNWSYGKVMDRRTEEQKECKVDTSDNPGAIRCIHTDSNPGNRFTGINKNKIIGKPEVVIPGDEITKNKNDKKGKIDEKSGIIWTEETQAYHNHAINTAIYTKGHEKIRDPQLIDTEIMNSGKFLLEYSGIPFGGEKKPHNNKIVFDYLNGRVFVTFDHYKNMIEVDMTK